LYDEVDLILLDVKHIDTGWHKKITGFGNENVFQTTAYRESTGKPMWLRYVLVPGYSDQTEFLHQWGAYFQSYKHIERVEILPYHTLGKYKYAELGRPYPLENVPTPSLEEINQAREIFKQYFKEVKIR
jgi:pyruvate formate lyase activating enzyme